MARKFRILQVGGKDLEPLFDSKKGVEWDYLRLIVVILKR